MFFELLEYSLEQEKVKTNAMYIELCDIAAIAMSGQQYHQALKEIYMQRLLTPEQLKARQNPRVFDCTVKERADEAAKMFSQFIGQGKKLSQRGNGRQRQ